MKNIRSGTWRDLQDSPPLRYVMAVILAFAALTSGLALLQRTLDNRHYVLFVVELLVIILFSGLGIWLSIPWFWKRKRETPVELDFEPDGKNFHGYEFQMKKFKEVLKAAESDRAKDKKSLLIAVFGTSGVGKSSFLMKCFDENPDVIQLDLRKNVGITGEILKEKLKDKFENSPQGMFTLPNIKKWLHDEVKRTSTENPLSKTVLILDQFEQIIANDESVEIAEALFKTIAPHCLMVIISIRSDILGNAAGRIRKLIPNPVDISRRLRLFELRPIGCKNKAEQMGLLYVIWKNVMKTSPHKNRELLEQLREILCGEDGHRTMLPVLAKLAIYAIKSEKITNAKQLKHKTKEKIGNLVEMLLQKECASTTNEDLALRIILSLSNSTGVSEGFTAVDLRVICATGDSTEEVDKILRQLDGLGDGDDVDDINEDERHYYPIGVVKDVGNDHYTLSHEYLGKLARGYVRKSMHPLEKEQLMVRQSLVKNSGPNFSPEKLCDVKNRVQLFRYEGLILLSGFLVGISRLFFWSPWPWQVQVRLHYEFLPAAIGFFGNSFFFWLFYGNVGKAIMTHQGTVGKVLWNLTALVPLVGWVFCCFYPREWLVIGSGVTLVAAITGLAVWHDTRMKYKNVAAMFKGFSITTFSLIPIFIAFYAMLRSIPNIEYYTYLSSAVATISLFALVRSGLHFWHGWFLRELLARIDLDIPLRIAEELLGERN